MFDSAGKFLAPLVTRRHVLTALYTRTAADQAVPHDGSVTVTVVYQLVELIL